VDQRLENPKENEVQMRRTSADQEISPVSPFQRQLPVWLISCASASEASLPPQLVLGPPPVAVLREQSRIELGILQRDRHLRRQQAPAPRPGSP
jgi:hypothetical protein